MPLRLDSLKKRWPTFDLPILPFLAPRVFTPWPSRSHYSNQAVPKEKVRDGDGEYDSRPRNGSGRKENAQMDTRDRRRAIIPRQPEQCLLAKSHAVRGQEESGEFKDSDIHDSNLSKLSKSLWKIHNPIHRHSSVLYGRWHARLAAITYDKLPPGPTPGLQTDFDSPGLLPGIQADGDKTSHLRKTYALDDIEAMRQEILDLVDNASSESLGVFWRALPTERALAMWMELMMTTMERRPEKALRFLSVTFHEPHPPAYAVADTLDFIIAHYHKHQRAYPALHLDEIVYRVKYVLLHAQRRERRGIPTQPIHLTSHSLWLLMTMFDLRRLNTLYEILVRTDHPLREHTLIQLAYRFAKAGQTDTAFEVLQRLKGGSFNTTPMLNLCAVILYIDYRDPKAFYDETTIFEFMVGCGLTPNVTTYSILMLNSIRSGDHKTAWKLHDMMLETQILPNKFTYSILLNDAKRRMDAEDIAQIMGYIRNKNIVSEHLVTDVLHTIYFLQEEKARQATRASDREDALTAFKSMLPVYCDNFELEHLARIIPGLTEFVAQILPPKPSDKVEKVLMVPQAATLTVMITAYLRSIKNAAGVMQLYHRLRELIYEGDPAVKLVAATETTHLWDMILITFGRFPELTNECAHVMEDMLNPVVKPTEVLDTSSAEEPDGTTDSPSNVEPHRPSHSTPKPSVYTWSILLKIFMDAGQAAAGEKVLSIMKDRNITPTIVTWGTLTDGYVGLRDADMVADAVDRLEDAGLAVNDHVLSMVERVSNRGRFLATLEMKKEKRRRAQELKVQEEIEAKAKAEAEAAEKPLDEDAWLEEEFADDEFR